MAVRTRFAPSPTGYLHIGGVRTALFNWLFARQQGGQFVLRIDDTDIQRNVSESLRPILDGFRWLGIDWDEGPEVDGPHGPYFQSQRQARYQSVVDQLLAVGAAYRDFATPEEIQQERQAAEQSGMSFVYSRRWMATCDADRRRFESDGRRSVVRLKMPREGALVLEDLVRGRVRFAWEAEQDHVIQRSDGTCLYHLATVVDDCDFEITHVIRAEEHLSNTPRQVFIAQALNTALPRYAHVPYVAEPGSKTKLSKRKLNKYLKHRDFASVAAHGMSIARRMGLDVSDETFNPVLVDFYRRVGFLPDAVLNYLLLLGWSLDDKTERFTRREMIRHFSLDRVNRAPAGFDPAKLMAMQQQAMLALPLDKKTAATMPFLTTAGHVADPPRPEEIDRLRAVVEAASDRIRVAGDILDYDDFFRPDDALIYDEKAVEKRLKRPTEAVPLLKKLRGRLAEVQPFSADILDEEFRAFVAEEAIKIGQIIHAARVAVTGKTVGFGLFDTLAILGRDSTLARIDRALQEAAPTQ